MMPSTCHYKHSVFVNRPNLPELFQVRLLKDMSVAKNEFLLRAEVTAILFPAPLAKLFSLLTR